MRTQGFDCRTTIAILVSAALAGSATAGQAIAVEGLVEPLALPPVLPNESLVSSQRDLLDPEYSQSRGMVTWCDLHGELWVAGVNRDTGLFEPSNGKGTLIDTDAMTSHDFKFVSNGPEWIGTTAGDQIVYTRFPDGNQHTPASARLGHAWTTDSGDWTFTTLSPSLARRTPYTSPDPDNPVPFISYIDRTGRHYWRNLFDESSETPIPGDPPSASLGLRLGEGIRAAAYTVLLDGINQVFLYQLDTGSATQVTFDASQKDLHSRPFIWTDPESSGDLFLMTVADDVELRIYALRAPYDIGAGGWQLVSTIRSPDSGLINSPEPFHYGGQTYVFFAGSIPPLAYPTAIFFVAIDGQNPVPEQLTPDEPSMSRTDPEVFVANDGPYIYFNRGTYSGKPFCLSCNEGVYRTYTGLPPLP